MSWSAVCFRFSQQFVKPVAGYEEALSNGGLHDWRVRWTVCIWSFLPDWSETASVAPPQSRSSNLPRRDVAMCSLTELVIRGEICPVSAQGDQIDALWPTGQRLILAVCECYRIKCSLRRATRAARRAFRITICRTSCSEPKQQRWGHSAWRGSRCGIPPAGDGAGSNAFKWFAPAVRGPQIWTATLTDS